MGMMQKFRKVGKKRRGERRKKKKISKAMVIRGRFIGPMATLFPSLKSL